MFEHQLEILIASKTKQSVKEVNKTINAFKEIVEYECKQGEEVQLISFGTFYARIRKGRVGVNPRTFKSIIIPDGLTFRFKPSSTLKKRIKQ